mgnify:CR=1 FL=1
MMKVTKPKLAKTGLSSKASIIIFYLKLKKIYKKDIDKIVFIFEPTGSYSNLVKK